MSEEERGELLRHLKIKWASLNAGALDCLAEQMSRSADLSRVVVV
jgi:hypothetical protein